jgi:putative ABC transport system permease protein
MYLRMLLRAVMLRKMQAGSALTAVMVAAAAATAMLNIYGDVKTKLPKEFRNFGANVVVQAANGKSFSPDTVASIRSTLGARGLSVPFAYTVARTVKDQPIVLAGTDFELAKKLNPWWSVSAWPKASGQALVGVRARAALDNQSAFTVEHDGHLVDLSSAGTLETGAGEDSRVYLSLEDFRSWTGLDPSVIEIAASGSADEINALIHQLHETVPAAEVRPVRQVTEGEANILGKTRSTLLSSAAFIVLTAALCVLATLMGWVFDRRCDFAIMKALGASDRLIALFVSGEAAVIALVGAGLGYACGIGIAAWIGRASFHAPVGPRLSILVPVLGGALAITLISTLLPLRLLRRIQPAMILRGE